MKSLSKAIIYTTLSCITASLLLSASAETAQAKSTTSITYQVGKKTVIDYRGAQQLLEAPYISNGYTMVPIRSFAEGLKMTVSWDKSKNEVSFSSSNKMYTLRVNDDRMWIDNKTIVKMPVNVTSVNGNIFVPIRAVSDVLNSKIDWQASTKTIKVSLPNSENIKDIELHYSFEKSNEDWAADYADLPTIGDKSIYELENKRSLIPTPGNTTNFGYYIKGMNRSDDLFMFLNKKVTGLQPNTTYTANMSFNLYSNVSSGLIGIGGAPAEAVYVKAGVVNVKPGLKIVEDYYRMNIDTGSQSQSGKDMKNIGNIGKLNADKEGYQAKLFTYETKVTTDKNGDVYLIIGTDSGFEGLTTVYYDDIKVKLSPVN
ncbi:copper amine oxidase N-terminal domain-containing protein [Paenibacillus sp. GSMTC-2017]|uniref:copper amine oxidase N-terminal domain-containing protein n=1 Tax=Paenibacillus sp. GSMTC-2017 TaxID=2794350 RepID=UPI0018D9C800|nr:copper amine oxidase N-terminal domain-containing protein [Paenibacillus sp. GSMTC-2017]MBH5316257.1 copper amine oxidase N-terminal domain-containing protein [Paenibacillus sp. GSMTC-2017]